MRFRQAHGVVLGEMDGPAGDIRQVDPEVLLGLEGRHGIVQAETLLGNLDGPLAEETQPSRPTADVDGLDRVGLHRDGSG